MLHKDNHTAPWCKEPQPGNAEHGDMAREVYARWGGRSPQPLVARDGPPARRGSPQPPYSCHALSLYGSLRRLLPLRLRGGLSRGGVELAARRWPGWGSWGLGWGVVVVVVVGVGVGVGVEVGVRAGLGVCAVRR